MKTWTIRQRILGSFAAVLALMIAMGGMAYTRLERVEQDATSIQKDYGGVVEPAICAAGASGERGRPADGRRRAPRRHERSSQVDGKWPARLHARTAALCLPSLRRRVFS